MQQKKIIANHLNKLAPKITDSDKMEFAILASCSLTTVTNYVSGRISNLLFAQQMLDFFVQKLEKKRNDMTAEQIFNSKTIKVVAYMLLTLMIMAA